MNDVQDNDFVKMYKGITLDICVNQTMLHNLTVIGAEEGVVWVEDRNTRLVIQIQRAKVDYVKILKKDYELLANQRKEIEKEGL